MALQYSSPYSGQKQMGMPPLDDEFLNDPDPAPPMPAPGHYNGYDTGPRSYEPRVPLPGLAPPGHRSDYSSSSPIHMGNDVSPPGLDIDDGYDVGFNTSTLGGGGSLQRWNGNMSMSSSYGGDRSPAPTRNDTMWEEQTVTLRRQAKFGFGLAVSGGRDNPHYQSGETSIVVSDVLAQGPAQGKLKINDRLLIVSGQSMENVFHKAAVDALRQAGNTVTITFKRKKTTPMASSSYNSYSQVDAAPSRTPVLPGPSGYSSQSLPRLPSSAPAKMGASAPNVAMDTRTTMYLRKKRSEGFGMQLGWVLFVQGLSDSGVASNEGVMKGDTINKINNVPVETLSYADARKLIQNSKEKLMLEISRNRDEGLGIPTPLSQSKASFETPTSRPSDQIGLFMPQPMVDDDEPIIPMQGRPDMAAPPRPPLPSGSLDFGDSGMPVRPPSPGPMDTMGVPEEPEGEERHIAFFKGTSVGLRLIGGNEVGIYVTAIQPNSAAEHSGVMVGDRIVQVNDTSLLGKTKEDVVMMLLGIIDEVRMIVRFSDLAHKRVKETGKGDKFFVRAHFDYKAPSKEEMSFKKGSVFRILDTMPDGQMGHWYAIRLDRTNQPAERGIIPNNNRADQLHSSQQSDDQPNPSTKDGRAGFFQRRGLRSSTMKRTKAKGDHWDEIVFGGQPAKFPAYERVLLRESGFIRPVVIFGPIADLVRDQLLQDEPDTYETPLMERKVDNNPGEPMKVSAQGTIKVHAIRDIMDKGKHCLLDITPNAVEQLNYAQCYPIVIFLNADSRSVVKEIRGQFLESAYNKGSRKYYQTGKKLKKFYLHTFTAMIPINADGQWYHQLREAVNIQQDRNIWMSETKSNEPIPDINLPMIGNLTLPADYESDAESVFTNDSRGDASFFTSEAESDFDVEKSPSNPDKEKENYSFKSPSPVNKEKEALPESGPPPDLYSTDDDEDDGEGNRSRPTKRKSRPKRINDRVHHNQSREDRGGRSHSRSRSRSRDRRSEVADLDKEEEEEKSLNVEARMQYADKLENKDWSVPARPSRKDMMKKRQEMKRSASQSRVEDDESQQNGHMENGQDEFEGLIQASVQVNVESAPTAKIDPYRYTRSTNMPRDHHAPKSGGPEKRPSNSGIQLGAKPGGLDKRPSNSGVQLGYNVPAGRPMQRPPSPPLSDDGFPDMPLPAMQQSRPPAMQQNRPPAMQQSRPPAMQQERPPPKKNLGIYKPTPFADMVVPSKANNVESAPPPLSFRPYESADLPPPAPKETTFGADDDDVDDDDGFPPMGLPSGMPTGMPSGFPPPPVSVQASIHMNGTMPKETTFDADLEDDEPLVAWSFPSDEVPNRKPPSPPIPEDIPHRQPPPPPESELPPPEPVYAKVQKDTPRESPNSWRSESPRHTQPTRTESPYSSVDDYPKPPPKAEREIVSVKSSFVESAPPPKHEDDDYKNQLRSASRQNKPRNESPYGWNPSNNPSNAKEDRSRARDRFFNDNQPPPPKETTFGAPSHGRVNNNNNGHHSPSPNINDVPNIEPKQHDMNKYPYERESYKAYRDRRDQTKHRSKSPGRMYQESSIYAPKGWKSRSQSPFVPIPVTDEALQSNEGHEIVAMARGVFDSDGGCLSSAETGVSIVIPKGAIPEGIRQEVYFKVCKDTNNLPPLDKDKGETLLSPLVMCGPHGLKWLQPVELRLPHRASKTPDGWSFNLKSSDSTQEGDTSNWRNMVIPGMEDSQCQVNANSVSVLVDHF